MATKHPDRLDWMAADLGGQQRTLAWYVARAEDGDRDAALRAVRWCVESLTPEALQQNGCQLSPTLADALRKILGLDPTTGDSRVLSVARKPPNVRPEKFNRMWWWCVRMDEILDASPSLGQVDAAEQAQGDDAGVDGLPSAEAVAKWYRKHRGAIRAYRNVDPG